MANLTIEQKNVKSLFQDTDADFLIPDYQRPYAWTTTECNKLWEDLFSFCFPDNDCDKFNKEESYFLGPIVTFKNNKQKEVIDGQQRLTTLMLLLRAFYNKFDYMMDKYAISMKSQIGKCIWKSNEFEEYDTENPKIDSQVATDESKDEFISILKDGEIKGRKSRYAENFNFFKEKIQDLSDKYAPYLPLFTARILNYCFLLPIEAESQNTALRIFSTLNDRGLPLSDADIFKAQFYKYYSSIGKKQDFIENWKELDKISSEIFHPIYGTPLDELFTRYMYFERAKTGNTSSTTEGLRKFYEGDGTYPLLRNPETIVNLKTLAEFWQDVNNQNDNRFTEPILHRLFVLNYAPNGMWTYIVSVYFMQKKDSNNLLDEEPFAEFLDKITGFVWAYAIIHSGVNSLRTPFFKEMVNIVSGNPVTFKYKDYGLTESNYRSVASTYLFSNSRAITKSMITWWAFQQEGQELLSLDTRFDIEHIYARNRQDKEKGLSNSRNIELLGNKSLLEKRINIRAADFRFEDKRKYYSGFVTDRGQQKEATKIAELKMIANVHYDFQEQDIIERNNKIINAFVAFLKSNDLIVE